MSAVASIDNAYYGTVEKALASAASGKTVVVLPNTNPIIKQTNEPVVVNGGVTLSVPYALGATNSSTSTSQSHELTGTIGNQLYIANGVTLKVNGTLEIGGILSGGNGGSNYAGQTCDQYSVVYMGTNAQIISNGTIYCYGYIEEQTHNNGSKVTIESGSIYMPFILRDFKGGSQTYGLYSAFDSHHSAPFNLYEFINVTPTLRINYEGNFYAWANLYASDKHNSTTVYMIGKNEGAVIRLTDSTYSYIEAKHDKTVTTGTMKGKTNLDIYGGASANPMDLKLQVGTTITVSTSDVYFPISYFYNINLRKAEGQTATAEFALNQRYKIMPGATLRVNEGAKLTASDLVVYSYFDDAGSIMAGNKYPAKDVPGNFIVNGTFVGTNFGGVIKTETNSGATITVTGETSLLSYEPKEYVGSLTSTKIVEWFTNKEQFKLYLFEGSGISKNAKSVATGTFYSKNGGWYSTTASIFYDPNGGVLAGAESEGPYQTGASGYLIDGINTDDPTKDYYEFSGWYMDSACTIPASGQTIYVNTYVYAKWTPVTYGINYIDGFYSNTNSGTSTPNSDTTFNVETLKMFGTPTNGSLVFDGFYLDSNFETKINMIEGKELVKKLTDSSTVDANGRRYVNIYLYWYPAGTETYTINYVNPKNGEVDESGKLVSAVQSRASDTFVVAVDTDWNKQSLPVLDGLNEDPTYNMYFDGWYLDSNYTEKATSINTSLFTGDSTTCTLYAKWVEKFVITVSIESISVEYYLLNNQSITLPTPDKIGYIFDEVDNNQTVIILNEFVYMINGTEYKPGNSFTATGNTTILGKIKSTSYYQAKLQAESGSVSVSVTGGYIIKSYEDPRLLTSYTYTNDGALNEETIYISVGSTVTATFTYNNTHFNGYSITYSKDGENQTVAKDTYDDGRWSLSDWSAQYKGKPANPGSFEITPYVHSIGMSSGNDKNEDMCIYGDAEVLMADGTTKLAKDVKLGDVVLTWSFAEGKYVATPIIFVERLENMFSLKTTLYFDDGTKVEIANGQSFFDVNKREFVSINSTNVMDYIGITIMGYDNGEITYKQIVNATVELVVQDTYEFITAYEYSFIYDNVLTMEPFMLYKLPFDITEEFKYDEESMMKDIETYGLYTYEEWSNLVTEEQFEFFNGKYIKVAVGKGYYTEDYIKEIISKYIVPENMS